jgi:hypothetical protein
MYHCNVCNCDTSCKEPILIRRLKSVRPKFSIVSLCMECENEKSRIINIQLPEMFNRIEINRDYFNTIPVDGKRVSILNNLQNMKLK